MSTTSVTSSRSTAGTTTGSTAWRAAGHAAGDTPASTPRTRAGRQLRPAQRRPVHLTRRGRLLLLAGLVALMLGSFAFGRSASQAASEAPARPPLQQVTVQPGDSLWSVAQEVAPGRDPRGVVDMIQRLNRLSGPELQVGQQLLLPAA